MDMTTMLLLAVMTLAVCAVSFGLGWVAGKLWQRLFDLF